MLTDKTVVLGVTGGIATYKAADLASKLTQAGAKVKVVMTKSALEFIAPLTFEALTSNNVITDLFQKTGERSIHHIELSEAADIIIITPATANIIAKIASGIADDMLTCTVLAAGCPIIIVPAMHTAMWQNPITQENAAKLKARGFHIIEPATGRLASGGLGPGRFPDTETIIGHFRRVLGLNGDLAGKRLVITAGGTQEPIDPVRIIGNRSSGKMGYAVAEAARDRGALVTLITAPTAIAKPVGMEIVPVETASQMKEAVEKAVQQADALVMAAAVADYQVSRVAAQKIKKETGGLTLNLINTPDILTDVKGNFLKIGFAAESQDLVANARKKVQNKKLDLIVANDITEEHSVFGSDTNKVTLIGQDGTPESLPVMSKRAVADRILDRVVRLFKDKSITYNQQNTQQDSFSILVQPAYLAHNYIHIPKDHKKLFPFIPSLIELNTDIGSLNIKYYISSDDSRGFSTGMKQWFKAHTELKVGDKLRVTIIEPMKRYRLEIVE